MNCVRGVDVRPRTESSSHEKGNLSLPVDPHHELRVPHQKDKTGGRVKRDREKSERGDDKVFLVLSLAAFL